MIDLCRQSNDLPGTTNVPITQQETRKVLEPLYGLVGLAKAKINKFRETVDGRDGRTSVCGQTTRSVTMMI